MKLAERIRASIKTFWGGGNWVDSNAPGNLFTNNRSTSLWIPGTRFNWDALTGELWMCPAVQACLNWIIRNFGQAPLVVREKGANGVWQNDPEHPILRLLAYPNDAYDGAILTQGIITSLELNGNAYVIIERNQARTEVMELWWVPHSWVTPYTAPSSPNQMVVDEYRVTIPGALTPWRSVPPRDMIHLTYGRDPNDPRMGLSSLASLSRDINLLQQLANYKPNIVRNFGVIGKFVSPTDKEVEFDPDELKERLDQQSQGDNAGSTLVVDFPVKIDYPGVSPKDLDIGGMGDMSECNIAACFGIHPQLVGLYVGRVHKTDASIKEHREEAWEGKLIPLGALISCQLGNRLLAEFAGTNDPQAIKNYQSRYKLEYDYSRIRPLQPDADALKRVYLLVFQAGIINVSQYCEAVGMPKPDPKVADLFWTDINGTAGISNQLPISPSAGNKSTTVTLSTEELLNGFSLSPLER